MTGNNMDAESGGVALVLGDFRGKGERENEADALCGWGSPWIKEGAG
jgi:hypothetical protein